MNILIVSDNFIKGGLETHIHTLYEAQKANHRFCFAFSNYSSELEMEEKNVFTGFCFRHDSTVAEFISDVEKLVEVVRENKIDVINAHPFYGLFPAVIAGQLTNTPVVYTYHGVYSINYTLGYNDTILLWYSLSDLVSKILCVTDIGRAELCENIHLNNAVFFPNPIDTVKYKKHSAACDKNWAYISRLDADGQKIAVLKDLISHLEYLEISGLNIYGDGSKRKELEIWVEEQGYSNKVCFMGYRNNIPELLENNCSGVVGMGRVAVEGLAMGYPVILAGYGRIAGLIDSTLFEEAEKNNFTPNRLPAVSFEELKHQLRDRQDNPSKYDLSGMINGKLDAATVSGKYIKYLRESACSARSNIIDFYNGINALEDKSESFYLSDSIFEILGADVELYAVNPAVRTLFIEHRRTKELTGSNTQLSYTVSQLSGTINQLSSSLTDVTGKLDAAVQECRMKEEQIAKLNRQLAEKQDIASELDRKLTEQQDKVSELTVNLQNAEVKISELSRTISNNSAAINSAAVYEAVCKQQVDIALANLYKHAASKSFKLVHFFNRFRWQLIHGKKEDRRAFRKWFFSRWNKTKPIGDHRYNALYTAIEPLELLKNTPMSNFVSAGNHDNLPAETVPLSDPLAEYQRKTNLMYNERLAGPISPEAEVLINAMENRKYKGILVYPHVVFWEPLQTPQQLLKAFAAKGWLCFFCESAFLENVFREEEPNLFITNEPDFLLAAAKSQIHVNVLLTWMGSMPFVDRLPHKTIWYHILDHLEIFSYYGKKYKDDHCKMLNRANCISYVASPLKKLTAARSSAAYIPNGCCPQEIVNIHEEYTPEDMLPILKKEHKIIGYFGYLAEWMDYGLVRRLAKERPDCEFVFVGKAIADTSPIDELPNVHLLGLKPYKELSDYAKFFDVAIIPFMVDEKMDCVSPIKFYEYLALGLPVICSKMPEIELFSEQNDFVFTADGFEDFNHCLDRALSSEIKEKAKIHGPLLASQNSWASRAETAEQIIEASVNRGFPDSYTKQDIIILSIISYGFRHQRPQHLAQRLASYGHRVFYVNVDFERENSIKEIEPNLLEVTLANEFGRSSVHIFNGTEDEQSFFRQLDCMISDNHIRDAVTVVDYPNWVGAAIHLEDKFGFKIVTDYMDDFTGFINPSVENVRENCLKLLSRSAAVAASSEYLYDIASKYNNNASIIRNGTEYGYFRNIFGAVDTDKQKKVIGYYGAIAEWFDIDVVIRCAERFPDCEILLVGAVTAYEEELKACSNVTLVGEVPYRELLPWVEKMDVCLIPFKADTDLIKATNPVKFYEYLAAGKKIVATEIPELMPYRNRYAYLENNPDQFADCVELCLNGDDCLRSPEEGAVFAEQNDWDNRAADFEKVLRGIWPKISIIVLCYNKLDYTKQCIHSIVENTAYPNYELIIVDNASSDGTAEYICSFAEKYGNVKAVINDTNLGFAEGNNVGLKVAGGDYFVLLNNDTVVTHGWLTGMLKHFNDGEKVGIVGPVTNSIGNEARIKTDYTNISEMKAFAYGYTAAHMGQTYKDFKVLAMYCYMFSRELYEEIGPLDENYGIGTFEDDDYCQAALHAGFRMILAEDVFIHHYESISFKQLKPDVSSEIFYKNRAYYEKKWGTRWVSHRLRPEFYSGSEG